MRDGCDTLKKQISQARALAARLYVRSPELPAPGPLGKPQRRPIARVIFAIGFYPLPQRGFIDPELPRDISDSARCLDDHPGCFPAELMREFPVLPCHVNPSFPMKIL